MPPDPELLWEVPQSLLNLAYVSSEYANYKS